MRNKTFFFLFSFLIYAVAMFGQTWPNATTPVTRHGGPDGSVHMRHVSPYYTNSPNHKVPPGEILPLTLVFKNNKIPRSVYVRIREHHPKGYTPVVGGYQMLSDNPTQAVFMNAYECKIFKFDIKVNTDKFIALKAIVLNDKNQEVSAGNVYINNPEYAHRAIVQFPESKLCDFSPPPSALLREGSIDADDEIEENLAEPQKPGVCCDCCKCHDCKCQGNAKIDTTQDDDGGDDIDIKDNNTEDGE